MGPCVRRVRACGACVGGGTDTPSSAGDLQIRAGPDCVTRASRSTASPPILPSVSSFSPVACSSDTLLPPPCTDAQLMLRCRAQLHSSAAQVESGHQSGSALDGRGLLAAPSTADPALPSGYDFGATWPCRGRRPSEPRLCLRRSVTYCPRRLRWPVCKCSLDFSCCIPTTRTTALLTRLCPLPFSADTQRSDPRHGSRSALRFSAQLSPAIAPPPRTYATSSSS
jgi:hypothetical protein